MMKPILYLGDCPKRIYQIALDFFSYSRRDIRRIVSYVTDIATQKTDKKTSKVVNSLREIASLAFLLSTPIFAADITKERAEEVVRRGIQIMPFDLDKTMHIFNKTTQGGIQQVIAKDVSDLEQIKLIHKHLTEIAQQFSQRNYSGPQHIHGKDMPGLKELGNAPPDAISINYSELDNGAQIEYSSAKTDLINAIHRWFDAQLKDHARHAMPGHGMHHKHAS